MKRELEQIRKRIDNLLSESRCLFVEMASLTCTLEDLEVIDRDTKLDQNWEDMEEETKNAALKRARDIMKKDIQAEKLRQEVLEEAESRGVTEETILEDWQVNDTPRTLYEE